MGNPRNRSCPRAPESECTAGNIKFKCVSGDWEPIAANCSDDLPANHREMGNPRNRSCPRAPESECTAGEFKFKCVAGEWEPTGTGSKTCTVADYRKSEKAAYAGCYGLSGYKPINDANECKKYAESVGSSLDMVQNGFRDCVEEFTSRYRMVQPTAKGGKKMFRICAPCECKFEYINPTCPNPHPANPEPEVNQGGPGGLGLGFRPSGCPYVIKPEVTAQMMADSRCDKTPTDCLTRFYCAADHTLGLAEEEIVYNKNRRVDPDFVPQTESEEIAVNKCLEAANCLKTDSDIGPVDSFKRINNAAYPSGCQYMPSRNRLVYNLARGNFGKGAKAGFRSICKAEADTAKRADDPKFHYHDFPVTEATHELLADQCGSSSSESGNIKADTPSLARTECQAAVEAMGSSHATEKTKIVNRPKWPHGCIINNGNGRAFYNRHAGTNAGSVWNDWKVVCRVTEAEADAGKRQKRKNLHKFW